MAQAWSDGSLLDVAAHTLQVLGVVLPVLACVLVLGRIGTAVVPGLATWSHGSARKRVAAAAISATLVTALFWAWWPHPGNYAPIEPGERKHPHDRPAGAADASTADALARPAAQIPAFQGAQPSGTAAQNRLATVSRWWPRSRRATRCRPRPPRRSRWCSSPPATPRPTAPSSWAEQPWVFPFDKPLPPAEGDNQALAVEHDGRLRDLRPRLRPGVGHGDEVLNVNEAHAYASCSDCVAVAVAFQVVLIMDDAQVVVPQNLSVSANYDCYRCITAAIASQLVLSVQEEPGGGGPARAGRGVEPADPVRAGDHTHSLTEISPRSTGSRPRSSRSSGRRRRRPR